MTAAATNPTALDLTRKLAWNGTLQRHLSALPARSTTDVVIGATALCRGEFEITASVEETVLWTPPAVEDDDDEVDGGDEARKGDEVEEVVEDEEARRRREKEDTQAMMDALLGAKERRIWHSRYPCRVSVRDPPTTTTSTR